MDKNIKNDLFNKEIFVKNLNHYLSLSGKMQKEVAAAVGISRGTFCDWTKGRAFPRMDKVQALADYFGIKLSDLLEIPVDSVDVASEDQEVLYWFHKVPKEKREFVLSMIRAASGKL